MRPMLATTAENSGAPPVGDEWSHEVKWDGMRVLADVHEGALRLTSRTEADVTVSFPELVGLASTVADVHLDGEVVALVDGRPSFGALADRMHVKDSRRAKALAERFPVTYVAFDVLRLYGVPLLQRPFDERRHTLERLELGEGPWQVPGVFEDGVSLAEATRAQGLEGVVSKRRSSRYHPGRRSRDWLKLAHRSTQTCVVGGWRPQTGTTSTIGSLLVGLPDPEGGLHLLGRVGSGIGPARASVLTDLLGPLAAADSPFRERVPREDAVGASWVRPELCVEVVHLGHSSQGRLRHPVLQGIRSDVRPEDLRREP